MNLQFISDGMYEMDVLEWHKDIVRQRLAYYKKNPDQGLDFDKVMDDIDNWNEDHNESKI